jgi:hypothetical protein
MKIQHLILAATASAVFTLGSSAKADEALLSPRAREIQIRTTTGSSEGRDLSQERPAGNAKAWEQARSLRKVSGTGNSVDLAHGPRLLLTPKDFRYDMALRNSRVPEFEVAPLK